MLTIENIDKIDKRQWLNNKRLYLVQGIKVEPKLYTISITRTDNMIDIENYDIEIVRTKALDLYQIRILDNGNTIRYIHKECNDITIDNIKRMIESI